ncbi:MAG: hypothetical protein ACOCXG_00475 [Nanoarchaeota archaeon]
MEKDKKTSSILKRLKDASNGLVKSEIYTEFFYLNRERKVVEFLKNKGEFNLETFIKELLPAEFRDFVSLKVLNDDEEEISTWYYEEELAVFVINVNWGVKKEEISLDLNINNFIVAAIDSRGIYERRINLNLLNDFIISFLTIQAKDLKNTFKKLTK